MALKIIAKKGTNFREFKMILGIKIICWYFNEIFLNNWLLSMIIFIAIHSTLFLVIATKDVEMFKLSVK